MITANTRARLEVALDSAGLPFSPPSCGHAYEWDEDGNLSTDTATDPLTGIVRVKTFTWLSGKLSTETAWVQA